MPTALAMPWPRGTGGGLDAGGMTIFRVAGGLGAKLTEALDLVDRHVFVAGQIQARVEQHGAVAGRQHETVAVWPVRRLGIEFQVAGKENGGDIRCSHRQAGVAGIGLLHSIHGKKIGLHWPSGRVCREKSWLFRLFRVKGDSRSNYPKSGLIHSR